MSDPTRTSAEIRAALEVARSRVTDIDQELIDVESRVAALTKTTKALKDARREITGGFGWEGSMNELQRELHAAVRRELDADRPRVTIDYGHRTEEHVVSRVTPKRIYTRKPGSTDERIWTHSGTPEGRWQNGRLADPASILAAQAKGGEVSNG